MSIAPADPTLLALLDAAVYSRIEEQSTRSETWAGEEKIKEEKKWKEETINPEECQGRRAGISPDTAVGAPPCRRFLAGERRRSGDRPGYLVGRRLRPASTRLGRRAGARTRGGYKAG